MNAPLLFLFLLLILCAALVAVSGPKLLVCLIAFLGGVWASWILSEDVE